MLTLSNSALIPGVAPSVALLRDFLQLRIAWRINSDGRAYLVAHRCTHQWMPINCLCAFDGTLLSIDKTAIPEVL